METSDWALIISCFSMLIALGSFVWNIWSKFIYPKAKVRTFINLVSLFPNPENLPKTSNLSVTNHGPGPITLQAACARINNGFFRKKDYAMLNPLNNYPNSYTDSNGPFSGGLPKKLEEGEQFSVNFPISQDWIDKGVCDFGFSDTLGRYHWCNHKNAKYFLNSLKTELNKQSKSSS